ncbi:hypothetical protein Tco_0227958 [Tanacetum coccineum]
MLAQPTEDKGAVSERPSEAQPTPSPTHPSKDQFEPQPDPFLRPSSSNPIPDSILEGSGRNHRGQSSSDRSQSGTEDDLTLQSLMTPDEVQWNGTMKKQSKAERVKRIWEAEEEKNKFLLRSLASRRRREKVPIEQRAKISHDTIAAQEDFLLTKI